MVVCTNSTCEDDATKVMAWAMTPIGGTECVFVASYCDEHADEVAQYQGAVFACGPALSEDVQDIEGVQR